TSIALVACSKMSGVPVGFAVGFRDPPGFYSLLRQRRTKLILISLLAMVRDPMLIPDILRNRRRVEAESLKIADAAELSSIAVRSQGHGVGKELVEAFVAEVGNSG